MNDTGLAPHPLDDDAPGGLRSGSGRVGLNDRPPRSQPQHDLANRGGWHKHHDVHDGAEHVQHAAGHPLTGAGEPGEPASGRLPGIREHLM